MTFLETGHKTNIEVRNFCYEHGSLPKHGNAALKKFSEQGKIQVRLCDERKQPRKNAFYLDDDKKLSFKKCGVKYVPKIGNPFTLDENKAFYGWTSEVTKYNSNDIHVFFLNHFELAYSPENERAFNQVTQNADSKCCVRLVKDK